MNQRLLDTLFRSWDERGWINRGVGGQIYDVPNFEGCSMKEGGGGLTLRGDGLTRGCDDMKRWPNRRRSYKMKSCNW